MAQYGVQYCTSEAAIHVFHLRHVSIIGSLNQSPKPRGTKSYALRMTGSNCSWVLNCGVHRILVSSFFRQFFLSGGSTSWSVQAVIQLLGKFTCTTRAKHGSHTKYYVDTV